MVKSRSRCWIFVIAALAVVLGFRPVLADPGPAEADKDDPETERQSFKLADGFEINLFASEAEGIVKPVQMRWDPRGRLWVACIPSYPQLKPGEAANDRIVILTPGASGHASSFGIFADGLHEPLGLELGDGGVYAGNGTDLVHLMDTHGNGHADRRDVILRGFVSADSHQDPNSFIWSPGGELFFCQGLHAYAHVETPWGVESLEKAGVWRLRPRRMQLDPFLGLDMGPQNPWGIVFDDWGRPIMIAGNGQGIYNLGSSLIRTTHHLDPAAIWSGGGIKLCGVDIIGTEQMPPATQGRMVCGSILNNAIYWFKISPDGSGLRAKDLPPLLTSKHNSFRPVDVKVGPDGAIYVADFYNPIIGHYQASLRHPDRDHAHGRIWRIVAKGRPLVTPARLAGMPPAGLLDQLRSPERWNRYQAKRLLADMDGERVGAALREWLPRLDAADPDYERILVEALGVYESQEIVEPHLLDQLLHARDERARAYATHVVGRWQDRLPDPLSMLRRAAADESPVVRVEAVVSASYVQSPEAVEAAAMVADRPMDRFISEALTQCVAALKPRWQPALEAGGLAFENSPDRLAAFCKADGTPEVIHSLVALPRSSSAKPELKENALVLVASMGSAADVSAVLGELRNDWALQRGGHFPERVLKALDDNWQARGTTPAGDLAAFIGPFLAGPDSQREAALRLIGDWRIEALRGSAEQVAGDEKASDAVRVAAMNALARLGGDQARAAMDRLAGAPSAHTRALAIGAMARLHLPAAAMRAAALLAGEMREEDLPELLSRFLAQKNGAEALGNALKDAKLSVDRAKLALRTMSSAGRQDPGLWALFSAAAGNAPAKRPYDPQLVASLKEEVARTGDRAAGEIVFRSPAANCTACHAISNVGGKTGPDLATIGTAQPADIVIESVLWPNKQVKEGFMATLVETRDGQVMQGYVASDEPAELVLRDPPTGNLVRLRKSEIKVRKEIGSLMPDGVTDGLTHRELVNLLRYLCELGR